MACLVLICQSRLERKTVKRKRVFATLKVLGSVLGQLTDELPEEVRSTVFSNIILFMAAHTLIFQLLILWTISGLFWEFELLCFFQATIFFFLHSFSLKSSNCMHMQLLYSLLPGWFYLFPAPFQHVMQYVLRSTSLLSCLPQSLCYVFGRAWCF